MPAWSVPGAQSVSAPRIRAQRINTSCVMLSRPWPTWRMSVTLGGGITIANGSRSPPTRAERAASAVKHPASSHAA
jgi:hypothetical protein